MSKSKFSDVPVKCFAPRLVQNKYNHKHYYVRCGKCDACLLQKSYEYSKRVEDECRMHRFSVFFTLTYDNDHVPYFRVVSDELGDYLYSEDCYKAQVSCSKLYSDNGSLPCFLPFLQNDKSSDLRIGHLNKYDIQCFLKRLRINITRKFYGTEEEKKIRYWICGEYGPSTFRPHYHGIIWTDCEGLANSLAIFIRESWPFADPNQTEGQVSLVESNAPQYVAAYCNGLSHLPAYLQLPETRPFHVSSKNPSIGFYGASEDEVQESVDSGLFTLSRRDEQKGLPIDVEIPAYLANRCFPRCRNFDELDIVQRVQIYSEAFDCSRRKVLEHIRNSFTREGCNYCSLDFVKRMLQPFQKYFNGTLKMKDLMLVSARLRKAAVSYMSKFGKSLLDFLHCVDRLHVHHEMVKLKNQFEMFNDYVFHKRYKELRFLYPENYEKNSSSYLGNSGSMFSVCADFVRFRLFRCWATRDSILDVLRCGFDFSIANFEPYSHKLFSFLHSPAGLRFQAGVSSEFANKTKFKKINDSGLVPEQFTNIF